MTIDSRITPELLDELLSGYAAPEDLTGEKGLFKQLKKALIERALGAELSGFCRSRPVKLKQSCGLGRHSNR
jgi:hypothetical protein